MLDKFKTPFYLSIIWYPIWETCGLVMEGDRRLRFAVLSIDVVEHRTAKRLSLKENPFLFRQLFSTSFFITFFSWPGGRAIGAFCVNVWPVVV